VYDDLAPGFEIEVQNSAIPANITDLIQSVEVESVDGYADLVKLNVANPNFILTDSPIFQPGNELNVSMGYGADLKHMGRFSLARHSPVFPQNNMPFLEIRGYTKDHLMMDNSPAEGAARVFPDSSIVDAVTTVAERYGMRVDIDDVPELTWGRIQKAGLTDYDFVKGLSNMTGFLFWVDGAADGTWTLHFRDPGGSNLLESIQDKQFAFKYNNGDFTTLLSFDADYALRGAVTALKVQTLNPDTGKLLVSEFEDDSRAPDVGFIGDVKEELKEPQTTAGAVKIFFGEFSIEVVANKKFKTAADVENWAKQWFRRNRENFVSGRGKMLGVESLMARQTHFLDGIGKTLSGEYNFTRVRHIMTNSSGYTVDFNARKVLG